MIEKAPQFSPGQPDQEMKGNINAARDAVQGDGRLYYSNTPSQEALNHGADWGKTEIIGSETGPTKATVSTEHGTQPDYLGKGPDAQPGYDVEGAKISYTKPSGERVHFETKRDSSTGELTTSYYRSKDGEILAESENVYDIGSRVVNLAARRIERVAKKAA